MKSLISFPATVNETSARLVAAGVVAQAVLFLVVREGWLLIPLVYGFLARVVAGPSLSPLGQFVTRVATPQVEATFGIDSRRLPGLPKRFAQGIGLGFTVGAALGWLAGTPQVSYVLLSLLVVAATLEAAFAICLGCIAYSALWGCEDCDDISQRLRMAVIEAQRVAP